MRLLAPPATPERSHSFLEGFLTRKGSSEMSNACVLVSKEGGSGVDSLLGNSEFLCKLQGPVVVGSPPF